MILESQGSRQEGLEGGWLQHRPASTAPDSMVPKALALENAGHDKGGGVGQVLAIDVGGTWDTGKNVVF